MTDYCLLVIAGILIGLLMEHKLGIFARFTAAKQEVQNVKEEALQAKTDIEADVKKDV